MTRTPLTDKIDQLRDANKAALVSALDLARLQREHEEFRRALLGQFADVEVGDFVSCRVTLGDGKGIVKEVHPLHRMVKLESGWCLHQRDELVEHIKHADLPVKK